MILDNIIKDAKKENFESKLKYILQAIREQNMPEDVLIKMANISQIEFENLLRFAQSEKYIELNGFSVDVIPHNLRCWRISTKGIKFMENIIEVKETKNAIYHVKGNANIANIHGNNNSVIQTNSQYNILKQMIENDSELDQPKKKSLLEMLDKFNTLKDSGENAFDLIKIVGGLAIKYVPLFFSLLK